MTARRSVLLVACLGAVIICSVLIPELRSSARRDQGGLLVAFTRFMTNAAPGAAILAEFTFSNGCPRPMEFIVADLQVRQTTGWPLGWRLIHGPWHTVKPGGTEAFVIVLPDVDGSTW